MERQMMVEDTMQNDVVLVMEDTMQNEDVVLNEEAKWWTEDVVFRAVFLSFGDHVVLVVM